MARSAAAAHAAGGIAYYAVSIPAQVPSGGVLTLRVVEGRLADYRLTNITRSTPTRLIAADMEQLMRERPLRRSSLERKLALLRESISNQVKSMSSNDQLDMIELQSAVSKQNNAVEMISTIVKKFADLKDSIVRKF